MFGIQAGMPDSIYFRSKGLSASGISLLMKCPALYKASMEQSRTETDAMRFGSLFHCSVLEHEELVNRYAVNPYSAATKAGKEFSLEAKEKGLIVVKESEFVTAKNMGIAVRNHAELAPIFNAPDCAIETPIFWQMEGIQCKAKPDIIATMPAGRIVFDAKSTNDASPQGIRKSMRTYGYHRQAWWYLKGMEEIGMPCERFVFFFVEKTYPYIVTIAVLDSASLKRGEEECREGIRRYKECKKTGIWKQYTDVGIEISVL